MKNVVFLISLLLGCLTIKAQNYLTHIVKSGENLSIIAGQYKVPQREIELLNNINEKVIIRVGQKILIPLGKTSVKKVEKTNSLPDNNVVAAANKNQYKVQVGDNLTKIARMYAVTEKQLLEWNNMPSDVILIGQVLNISKPNNFVAKKTEPTSPIVSAKTEPKKEIISVENVVKAADIVKPAEVIANKDNVPLPKIAPLKVDNAKPIQTLEPVSTNLSLVSSAFESQFQPTGITSKLKTATFKTGAGWQDKKYYILSNTISIGTTVKLNYNNKITYAKVLGTLPIQANEEQVQMRMSTATAASIGAFDAIFNVEVMY